MWMMVIFGILSIWAVLSIALFFMFYYEDGRNNFWESLWDSVIGPPVILGFGVIAAFHTLGKKIRQ